MPRWQSDRNDIDARLQVKDTTNELKKMTHERAEYSATAIAALKTFRNRQRTWIEPLLFA